MLAALWLSFWQCAGLSLNSTGALTCLMFTVASERNMYSLFVLAISIICNLYSIYITLQSTNQKRPWLLWNILLWQTTNTCIFALLIFLNGIERFQLHIFLIHTILEWSVSITMEIYANGFYHVSVPRIVGISIVFLYSFIHSLELFMDDHLLRVAHVGLGGYILDGVGLFFSLKFAYDLYPEKLGLYCFAAYGGHCFAIIGSLFGCMISPILHQICLYGFSLLQNVSSTISISLLLLPSSASRFQKKLH